LDTESLVDRIYEAGLVPDLWPALLETLTARFEGVGTVLFTAGRGSIRWTSSPGFAETVAAFVDEGWAARNVRPARVIARRLAGFVTERDVFTAAELEQDPLYTGFMRPRGLGGELGTVMMPPTGDNLVLSINRRVDLGPASPASIEAANLLRPHLARAALFSARLGLERARAAADALRAVGLPAAVLADRGRLMSVNDLFEALMPAIVHERRDRVALADKRADELLNTALVRLRHGGHRGGVCSIPIRGVDEAPAVIVHLLPILRSAHDVFASATSILLATPVTKQAVPTAEILEGLFDLTPAEARVARAIGEGDKTPERIADLFGVSRETVRSQLRSVMAKTGTGRQAELVGLLAGTGLVHNGAVGTKAH
jgi:DNA-binding CsgD family transcriptional regulator